MTNKRVNKHASLSLAVVLAVMLVGVPLGLATAQGEKRATSVVNWLQDRRDNQRSGFNAFETILTPSSIAASPYGFGLKAIAYFPYSSSALRSAPLSAPVIYRNVMYVVAPRIMSDWETPDSTVVSLWALDPFTGVVKWTKDLACMGPSGNPAIDTGANVIIIPLGVPCQSESVGGLTVAVDLTTRQIRWTSSRNGGRTPAVVGGNAYYSAMIDGGANGVVSVRSATGQVNWSLNNLNDYPTVGNGVVYLGGRVTVGPSLVYASGALEARQATDGALRWTRSCPEGVCAFTTSGVLKWSYPTGGGELTLANNVLYMTCDMVAICAVNATTGALIWRVLNDGTGNAMTAAGGILYVLSGDTTYRWFRMLDAATGNDLSIDYLFVRGLSATAPVVNNGRVYVVSDNRIEIFGLCDAPTQFKPC